MKYDFKNIPLDDKKTWDLLCSGRSKGCFQVEGSLGQEWLSKIKPRSIEDLAAVISLIRPGPLASGQSDTYYRRRSGKEDTTYISEHLKPILESTEGVLIYQESAISIVTSIAGFDESAADLLRKSIGKKLTEEMAKVKKQFLDGAEKQGLVTREQAEEIFSWIETAQRYSFNKSHAVSYAYLSYQTAYAKAHYPTEFYTASLNYSHEKIEPKQEIYELIQDARLNNVEVLPPSIISANQDFEIVKDGLIRFGLSHIRNVGASAIKKVKSNKNNLASFNKMISSVKSINKMVAEALVKSGACDEYGLSRLYMLKCIHLIYGQKDMDGDIFKPLTAKELRFFIEGMEEKNDIALALQHVIDNKGCVKKREVVIEQKIGFLSSGSFEDTARQNSIFERVYLGFPLTCSAADDFDKLSEAVIDCKDIDTVLPNDFVSLHVVIDRVRKNKTRKNKDEYCYLTISDRSCSFDSVVCWPKQYKEYKDTFSEGNVVHLIGKKDVWRGKTQIVVNKSILIG